MFYSPCLATFLMLHMPNFYFAKQSKNAYAEFILPNKTNMFAFLIISQHWDSTVSLNPSYGKTMKRLSYIVNTMDVDHLATVDTSGQIISDHGIDLVVLE